MYSNIVWGRRDSDDLTIGTANQVETSECPLQTETTAAGQSKFMDSPALPSNEASLQAENTGGGQSKLTPEQIKNKRQSGRKYTTKIEELRKTLEALVPGCIQHIHKEQRLEAIIDYVQSFQRKEQAAKDQIKHLKDEVKQLGDKNKNLEEQLNRQSLSLQIYSSVQNLQEEPDLVNAPSAIVEELQETTRISGLKSVPGVESQSNPTEASRDAPSQVQVPPHNDETEPESVFPSNEEARHGTCDSGNESDEDEFSSHGDEDESPYLNCMSGNPSAMVPGSNKRKQSEEEAEVDLATTSRSPAERVPDKADMLYETTVCVESHLEENEEAEVYRATTSQSFAERIREDLANGNIWRLLEELVPDYTEVPDKGEMLGKIKHYLESLQQQILILSMQVPLSHLTPNGNAAASVTKILMKLDADEVSSVDYQDFSDLDKEKREGEKIVVGRFEVPISLQRVVDNIRRAHGDVSVDCKTSKRSAESTYLMFCASVKEMSEVQLELVTEDRLLKWRDAIIDASRGSFKVDFAMEHLKKIACAYIGIRELLKLENEALRMFKDVSSGELPITGSENVNGDDDGCRSPAREKRLRTV